jgi:hypothetical protein
MNILFFPKLAFFLAAIFKQIAKAILSCIFLFQTSQLFLPFLGFTCFYW